MQDADAAGEQRARAQLETIDAQLVAHADVASAVAALRADQLVAYVVASSGRVISEDTLRSHLKAALPAYMVPRHVVVLDALPRAADGSVDRALLPAPRTVIQDAEPVATAVRHDCDARIDYLIGVWSTLLDRPVATGDNFFDLGGHSMLAVQMANRVKIDTGVRIQLMTLATQTLAQVAAELPLTGPVARAGMGSRLLGNLKGLFRSGRPAEIA